MEEADYSAVVKQYLMGDDVVNSPLSAPTRWIIDFGVLPLEVAERWPAAMAIVRERVRPSRLVNRDRGFREKWWQFGRPRPEMRAVLREMSEFIVCNRVGKRIVFARAQSTWCLGDKVVAFRLNDDFGIGVLTASIHSAWAWMLSSTLKADLNYTPTSAFETFPWPHPVGDDERREIADLARRIVERRQQICAGRQIGLTKLYNEVDEGAYTDLPDLHRQLDEAVAAAYGWPRSVAHDADETNRRLLELNREIAAGERPYDPFGHLR